MKKVFYLGLGLFLTTLFFTCKETNSEFAPGAGDARITGMWQLVERRFPVDVDSSVVDSFLVAAHYEIDSVTKDSVYKQAYYKKTITKLTRTVDTTITYPNVPVQSLSFSTDGKLSANGNDLSYYAPIHYFHVDSTISSGLGINLYISTNRAIVPFRIAIQFQNNTLLLKPRCDGNNCYSKFIRVNR